MSSIDFGILGRSTLSLARKPYIASHAEVSILGVNIDSIGADSLEIAAVFLFVLFSLWNHILRCVARAPADSVQEGKAIPHINTDLCTEFASSSCISTNEGTNMSLIQVDNSVRDAACFGIHQDALLAVQLTDHKKFLPPVRAQARKACPEAIRASIASRFLYR